MEESTKTLHSYKLQYNKEYYDNYGHENHGYLMSTAIQYTTHALAGFLIGNVKFNTHLDVGCAFGSLVAILRKRGKESYGVDVSDYAILNAVQEARRYVQCADILLDTVANQYDLVTCVEVIEHLPKELERDFLDKLTELSSQIFLSSEDNHNEPTHLNPMPVSYWISQFIDRGYAPSTARLSAIPWGRLYVKTKNEIDRSNVLDHETRFDIYRRDNLHCVLCGKKGIQIHEILPRSFFGSTSMWKCFAPKNRISLCPECHSIAHTKEQRSIAIKAMSEIYHYTYPEQHYALYQE